jgi:arabinose-5-phosphate isomerase
MDALVVMSAKRMGMTCIVDGENKAVGILTDGDLRRLIGKGVDIQKAKVKEVMSQGAQTISANALASEAALIMETKRINHLLIVSDNNELTGALGIHDLLEAKIL